MKAESFARPFQVGAMVMGLWLLTGCGGNELEEMMTSTPFPTPTVNFFFSSESGGTGLPVEAGTPPIEAATLPPPVLSSDGVTISTPPIVLEEQIQEKIYDEALDPNWILQASGGLTYTLQDSTQAHNGRYTLSITPQEVGSSLNFYVDTESIRTYSRENVVELSFWLYSRGQPLQVGDLNLGVTGSNEYPYWVEGDNSALNELIPTFSGDRLYSLGIQQSLPADTWVWIVISLNDLVYDPDFDDKLVEEPPYEFLTGFSLKIEQPLTQTLFMDEVELLLVNGVP